MSIAGILDAMRTEGWSGNHRLVWQCLENHANAARFWQMTYQAIAEELGLGLNTVARAIARLEAKGIIEVERPKRRPAVFRMLKTYAKQNGKAPHHHADLTTQNGDSTPELNTQNGGSTTHSRKYLTTQNGGSDAELTPQNGHTARVSFSLPLSTRKKDPPEREPPISPVRPQPPRPPAAAGCVREPLGFAEFWEAYPRKEAKGAAIKAYAKALTLTDPATLLDALDRNWPSRKYTPHPATWLNDQRWLDEIETGDPVLRAVMERARRNQGFPLADAPTTPLLRIV